MFKIIFFFLIVLFGAFLPFAFIIWAASHTGIGLWLGCGNFYCRAVGINGSL